MRLSIAKPRFAGPVALLIGVAVVWLFARQVFWVLRPAALVVLLVGTYWLIRPELRAALGTKNDHRPWLVRLREHRWRPVGVGDWTLPRGVAYLAGIFLWYLWL